MCVAQTHEVHCLYLAWSLVEVLRLQISGIFVRDIEVEL